MPQFLGHGQGIVDVQRVGQQHDELVAAVPGNRVAGADFARHPPGALDQHGIAHLMPVLVVDFLEMVEIEQQQREGIAVADVLLHRLLETVHEQETVGQAGQQVMRRQVG